jgi:Na+/H+-translocating membrane pyrophosphatase
MANTQESKPVNELLNAAKLGADIVLLPGSSYLVEGKILPGVAASVGGIMARALFGPLGWASVGLLSYCLNKYGSSTQQPPAQQPPPASPEKQA